MYLFYFLAVVSLRCCMLAFSSCGKWGLVSSRGVQASHCGGFSGFRAWILGARAPVVAAHGLSSCGSWALEHRLNNCGTQV